MDPSRSIHQNGGTPGFRAPEFYTDTSRSRLTPKADVYSFALTMASLCKGAGAPIFPCGSRPENLRLPRHLVDWGIEGLLRHCLAIDPRNRLDMSPRGVLFYVPGFKNLLKNMTGYVELPPNLRSVNSEFARPA